MGGDERAVSIDPAGVNGDGMEVRSGPDATLEAQTVIGS
jgi:hypothetical protein